MHLYVTRRAGREGKSSGKSVLDMSRERTDAFIINLYKYGGSNNLKKIKIRREMLSTRRYNYIYIYNAFMMSDSLSNVA